MRFPDSVPGLKPTPKGTFHPSFAPESPSGITAFSKDLRERFPILPRQGLVLTSRDERHHHVETLGALLFPGSVRALTNILDL